MKKLILTIILILPLLVFAQDSGKKKAYFFFLTTCPHCHNVDNYFQANGIYEKYDITKLDASNPFNANLLNKFYDTYSNPEKGGVPAVAFGDKFFVGDQPIIDNFQKEIDASTNAYELPDPSKVSSSNNVDDKKGNGSQNNQAAATNGNKKNYFPVVIVALVAICAGVLVYINRRKS